MGFPSRPSRKQFGPERIDDGLVTDHERYVDAPTFNLDHWQTAGLGAVSPRAWALFEYTGSRMVLYASGEAWDPNGEAVPALGYTSTGVYTITYPATAPDEDANMVPIALVAGIAAPQVSGAKSAFAIPRADGCTVDVTTFSGTPGSAADFKALVLLW